MNYTHLYDSVKEDKLFGRYIANKHIEPLLNKLPDYFEVGILGKSVLGKSIYNIKIGSGKIKILMWSQMHGNESTTTKALFDFFKFLQLDSNLANNIKENFTFLCIPILNPDGAEVYTRENANNIDLNRDAINKSEPETNILRAVFDDFKPDFCYNLHDQRTIYAVGDTNKPATVSFLAPAYNYNRDINANRQKAIDVIVAMNNQLQMLIPGQVGRFDDSFNGNCVGDTFQSLGVPTILFEAGHFPNDYEREETRKYIFIALISGINWIVDNLIFVQNNENYIKIPQNRISFYDFVYKKITFSNNSTKKTSNFAAQYEEVLKDNTIFFEAYIAEVGDLEGKLGHYEFDANYAEYSDNFKNLPEIGTKADFNLNKSIKFINGLIKI